MGNEPLGIVAERIRDRKVWGDYEYRAPVLADAKETKITVDVPTGSRTIEELIRMRVDEVLTSEAIENVVRGSLERVIRRSIAQSEEMTKWRERQLRNLEALPEIDEILQVVYDVTGITYDELCSHRRARRLAWPRQLACWLIYGLRPDLSLPRIGQIMGGRDHTTVMHGRNNVGRRREQEPFKSWLADPRVVALLGTKGDS